MVRLNVDYEDGPESIVCIVVSGSLDAHSFEDMEGIFDRLFARGKHQIVVNVSGLEYISSAGAGVFIGAAATAQEAGGNIVLVNPNAEVREIFELLGVDRIFPVVLSREAALGMLSTA